MKTLTEKEANTLRWLLLFVEILDRIDRAPNDECFWYNPTTDSCYIRSVVLCGIYCPDYFVWGENENV